MKTEPAPLAQIIAWCEERSRTLITVRAFAQDRPALRELIESTGAFSDGDRLAEIAQYLRELARLTAHRDQPEIDAAPPGATAAPVNLQTALEIVLESHYGKRVRYAVLTLLAVDDQKDRAAVAVASNMTPHVLHGIFRRLVADGHLERARP